MGWRETIVSLNSLGVGDLEAIQKKLVAARLELGGQGQPELAERVAEASAALGRGDLPEYRRLLALVVSRLGHLKD